MNKPTVMSTGEWFFPIAVWHTGKTPVPFNTDKDDSDTSIGTIAQECGFGSSAYFSKVFSQREGISPSEYRRTLCHSEK